MPHGARIQQAFGGYDISNVQAHTGPDAQAASAAMGAEAYAAYHQPPGPKGTFLAAVDPTTKTWFDAHVDPKGGVGSTENAAEPKPEGEG